MSLPKVGEPLNGGGPTSANWSRWFSFVDRTLASISTTSSETPESSQTVVNQGAGIQVTGNPDSGYNVSLRTLADSGEGTFKLITRDGYGRISGSADGTAADVPYDNTTSGLTADDVQAAIDEVAAAVGSSSTTAWALLNSWDFSVSGAVASIEASLAGYNEVLVVVSDVTLAASGYRALQISGDGGTTWQTSYDFLPSTGVRSTSSNSFQAVHTTASGSARSGTAQFPLLPTQAPVWGNEALSNAMFMMPALGSKPNRIKVGGFTGSGTTTTNMTGGKVFIYAR